ncbi:MAG TPA: 6-phosphofructokinase [Denitromonas sp.]|nr:6-phosphofructokinase [Rhodocyclaceae bacterium]MCP5220919.1 6-phosphofructokinase [Zoogloeaceae bacterium]HPR06780.1 6-phosphofructokinase [Denitromonas sp.]HQU87189.1 6-phosphofructokinase [Denitromonas sp.]HQV13546.1 6-phosphofructokinase [Denitromonas sp.]
MAPRTLLYAQSGGVTAVINATAAGVITEARKHSAQIGRVLGARQGVLGVLGEDLLDTAGLSVPDLAALAGQPGGAFGSCRFDLDAPDDNPAQFERLFEVFAAHEVGYFLYNGGNGSMDTVLKLSAAARARNYPLTCVGVPKTVDNDLVGTDVSPGYGSAAKYLATSMREAGMDLRAMSGRRGRIFVMEVMGRNCGWLAAATVLARQAPDDPPHVLLLPEVPFDADAFLARVEACVERLGYCAITAAEGVRNRDGVLLVEQDEDVRGHVQLGGIGQWLARLVHDRLGYKHHWAVPDYLQRAAGHLVSATDRTQAEAVGQAAVRYALEGRDAVMPAIVREGDAPYRWRIEPAPLEPIANAERRLPADFIAGAGFDLTGDALRWLRPLIAGEIYPAFFEGLPDYRPPTFVAVGKKLGPYTG